MTDPGHSTLLYQLLGSLAVGLVILFILRRPRRDQEESGLCDDAESCETCAKRELKK